MTIMNAIRLAFRSPAIPKDVEGARREADRHLVSRFASGNIWLRQGRFSTKEDIDEQRERVKSYDFDD